MNKVTVLTVATHSEGMFNKLINNDYNMKIEVLLELITTFTILRIRPYQIVDLLY